MVGNVAALARQVLDLAASVVRYTAVKLLRATRSLTVRGSIFGDNSICSLSHQLVLIRLDNTIMVPRPCIGKRGRKEPWSCRESNPGPLAHHTSTLYVCMICAVGTYVCLV